MPSILRTLLGQAHRLPATTAGRCLTSLAALGAVASVGAIGTQSVLGDQVTMARVSVTGGTLDMVAGSDVDDTATPWTGSLSVALTGLKPGDENSGTVEIDNTGDLPFTLTASTAGADASSCFSYFFRETSVTGGTGAASHPVAYTGMGTGTGSDATTVAFADPIVNRQLPDVGGDLTWETDDKKVFTLTVRMKQSCAANAASGTLDFTFDAAQV